MLGGLETDEQAPGFKHSIIQPHIGGDLDYAKTSYMTPYGRLETYWQKEGNEVELNLRIPHNTTASIILDRASGVIDNGGLPFEHNSVSNLTANTGSGCYTIRYSIKES